MQMQLELKRIQREVGTTFIYVTHDQAEAITMSDRIAVMNNGRIEQLASPQEIYDQPATRFVASFIGNANLLPVEIDENADPLSGLAQVSMGGLTFQTSVAQKPSGRDGWMSSGTSAFVLGCGPRPCRSVRRARVRDAIFAGSTVTT